MPQGKVETVPRDGLTTRQRRRQAVLAVHTGHGKGKSTAAFGMAMRAVGDNPAMITAQGVDRRSMVPLGLALGNGLVATPSSWICRSILIVSSK